MVNQWGKAGGENPQRNDLWQVDLGQVRYGLNANEDLSIATVPNIPRYYHASVVLPEMKINTETIKRDSRSYNMPSWDAALEPIRMTFVVDDGGKVLNSDSSEVAPSKIYTLLDAWRSVVRAGRGAVGNEPAMTLNAEYRIEYAFPVYIYLLKGQSLPWDSSHSQVQSTPPGQKTFGSTFDGNGGPVWSNALQTKQAANFTQLVTDQAGLDVSGVLCLENAWLAGFKLGELNYERTATLMLEATIYADNILSCPT